jgi:hypothetical protein
MFPENSRLIPGLKYYRADSNGKIWSYKWKFKKPVWVKLKSRKVVTIYGVPKLVHRLVLMAFKGPCPPGMEACHFPDSSWDNNKPSNLRWGTHKENEYDKVIHGTSNRGERAARVVLTAKEVREIRAQYPNQGGYKTLGIIYQLNWTTIRDIIKRRTWRHI